MKSIRDCNNKMTCTVQVDHSSYCQPTDYENVTYVCVKPGKRISLFFTSSFFATRKPYPKYEGYSSRIYVRIYRV